MEFAGVVYTSSKEAFDCATDENINAALAQTTLPANEVLPLISAPGKQTTNWTPPASLPTLPPDTTGK
jgi:hypothetical protein